MASEVSDEAITEVLRPVECVPNPYGEGYLALGEDAEQLLPAVRALLDAQTAAHAAYWDEPLVPASKLEAAEAEVEALRAEVERLRGVIDEGWARTARPAPDTDRAVAEALEHAAQKIEQEQPWPDGAVAIVRSLIPGGTDD